VDIGFAIGSIMRLQVPRVRVENGWALGKFAGGFAQARRLTLGSSNLVYFCEPTLRTQLHISVCGLNVVCCETAIGPELGAKRKCRARAQNVADDPKPTFAQYTIRKSRHRPYGKNAALAGYWIPTSTPIANPNDC